VLTEVPAQICPDEVPLLGACCAQNADPIDLPRLLRVGGEWRGEEHHARAREERASVHHSIT